MSTNEPPPTRKQADEVGAVEQTPQACVSNPTGHLDAWEQRELYKAQQRRNRRQ
jgi:hypothetical protein